MSCIARTAMCVAVAASVLGTPPLACGQPQPIATQAAPKPEAASRFATPAAAVAALRAALAADDTEALLDIFGREFADVVFGSDPASARVERRRAAAAAQEKLVLRHDAKDRITLLLGKRPWPMPIPLVRADGAWVFDTAAGAEELRARRIGQDELSAISALKAFVRAERLYAAQRHAQGKPLEYARYIQSTPGRTDGLWWDREIAATAGPSPLDSFAASQHEFLEGRQPGDPFRGYYFRILAGQGAGATGGAKSYVEDGRMTKGFAMIGWPADYRQSGVMTFIVNHDGRVLQKDLGEDTASLVQTMLVYAPDGSWAAAEERARKGP